MANTKSALKRVQIAERNRVRNKSYRSAAKTLIKKYFAAVEAYSRQQNSESLQEAQNFMAQAYSKIDKAVKRGVLHANNAARQKSRLSKRLKQVHSRLQQSEASTADS